MNAMQKENTLHTYIVSAYISCFYSREEWCTTLHHSSPLFTSTKFLNSFSKTQINFNKGLSKL